MASPYARNGVKTVGVVTAIIPGLQGFWIQEMESDDDPATSAGLFIFFPEADGLIQLGDLVQIEGTVRESFSQTAVEPPDAKGITVISSDNALPDPVIINPPENLEEAIAYNESLEGMLVQLGEPAVVAAPTNRFGEFVLIPESWETDILRRGEEKGYFIVVDDGTTISHSDQSTMAYAVQRGDVVSMLVGPLAYTFGNYKVVPVAPPEIVFTERPLPSFPAPETNQFSVATFNVENFFDIFDPHPSSPPRPTIHQYNAKLAKLADAIIQLGAPTVIALQEVENIGVLESLVELEVLAAYDYQPVLIEGDDSRGIDNGYLVRGDMATVTAVEQVDAPDDLISRYPLMITVDVHLDSGDKTVIFINSHLTSLAAGEAFTEPRRTAQAALSVGAMEAARADNPGAEFIILGDLNSFYDTLPIHTIQDANMRHVYEFVEGDALPYTYIFEGRAQTLDHILLSEGLFGGITAVAAPHISTDYPIPAADDLTAVHPSDHDPLIVLFIFQD